MTKRFLSLRPLRALRRLWRRRDGTMLVEAVLVMPLMLWGYVALYTYWDAYRTMTALQKTAYTMSDLISREQRPISAAYITGLRNTMNSMLIAENPVKVRVTSVKWEQHNERYVVEWSNSPSGMVPLTTASVATLKARLPKMSDGRTAIIFEARLDYEPALTLGFDTLAGIESMTFEEFIVTPPRYAPRIVLQ